MRSVSLLGFLLLPLSLGTACRSTPTECASWFDVTVLLRARSHDLQSAMKAIIDDQYLNPIPFDRTIEYFILAGESVEDIRYHLSGWGVDVQAGDFVASERSGGESAYYVVVRGDPAYRQRAQSAVGETIRLRRNQERQILETARQIRS